MKEQEYYNVPIYIEKAIKKVSKLNNQQKEQLMMIKDYMESHAIPLNTPFEFMKHVPDEEVNPNQIKMEL